MLKHQILYNYIAKSFIPNHEGITLVEFITNHFVIVVEI